MQINVATMRKAFLGLASACLLSPPANARTIESVVEDVTWDLLFVVRPLDSQSDVPTETLILFTDGVFTPSLASTELEKCREDKKQLKILEAKLREYLGIKVVSELTPDSKPVWFGEGFQSTFVFGEHTFEGGKTLRDVLLEAGAGVEDPRQSPPSWWRNPSCMEQ